MVNYQLNHQISPKAQKVWLINELISDIVVTVILVVLFALDHYFDWVYWIGWILIGVTIIFIPAMVWGYLEPKFRYKSWRYQIDQHFFQTKNGIWKETWVTVPMSKIQGVSTSQGPVLRAYQLRSVSIETMGEAHEIPALDEDVALKLRDQIAEYAKLKEVEEG